MSLDHTTDTKFCRVWSDGEGIPSGDCPVCRAERAERERDEAKPVLEVARTFFDSWLHRDVNFLSGRERQLVDAFRDYDAARAAGEER